MWVNYNPSTIKLKFGAIFEPQGNTGGETIYKDVSTMKLSVQPGYGTNPERLKPAVDLSDTPLKDGTYKVTFASVEIETGGDDIWTPVMQSYGNSNYVVLKRKETNTQLITYRQKCFNLWMGSSLLSYISDVWPSSKSKLQTILTSN